MHPLHHPLFLNFMVYFNQNQDYFECHEVLEEYWKSLPDGDKKHPLTAYILLATGMYHWRRGNTTGALRTLRKAQTRFPTFSDHYTAYTEEIDFEQLICDIHHAVERLENGLPFESFPIASLSAKLVALIEEAEHSMTLLSFGSDAVIHKHMLRDRSDILRERNKSAKARSWRPDEEKKKGRC